MTDPNEPLRDLLNRSGIPFQLAVENAIRTVGTRYGVEVVRREMPWANGFLDIVARRDQVLFAFECKRVEDKSWIFVISDDAKMNQSRCRLEWFNGRAPAPKIPLNGHSRVFCAEWNMVEGSPESDFCIVPKGTPIGSLEAVCRDLLLGCHDLLADEEISHGGEYATIVPVVITTAKLYTCRFDPAGVPIETGKLDVSAGQFTTTDLVRFRKSLVTARSNSYDSSKMVLKDWGVDRERTVFIVVPSALQRFLAGFRSFLALDFGGVPKEFKHHQCWKNRNTSSNSALHRIAARWRFRLKPKGYGGAARGELWR
jgi:hypothetical protein